MSRTSWIALLLALGIAFCGCKSEGDDDDAAGDDDTDGCPPGWDCDYFDDDDTDFYGHSTIEAFNPTWINQGQTPRFRLKGRFCDNQNFVYFLDESTSGSVYAEELSPWGHRVLEGVIPDGLWIGAFDVCVECSPGSGECLPGGLDVLTEGAVPGDDDDSAGDDDDSAGDDDSA